MCNLNGTTLSIVYHLRIYLVHDCNCSVPRLTNMKNIPSPKGTIFELGDVKVLVLTLKKITEIFGGRHSRTQYGCLISKTSVVYRIYLCIMYKHDLNLRECQYLLTKQHFTAACSYTFVKIMTLVRTGSTSQFELLNMSNIVLNVHILAITNKDSNTTKSLKIAYFKSSICANQLYNTCNNVQHFTSFFTKNYQLKLHIFQLIAIINWTAEEFRKYLSLTIDLKFGNVWISRPLHRAVPETYKQMGNFSKEILKRDRRKPKLNLIYRSLLIDEKRTLMCPLELGKKVQCKKPKTNKFCGAPQFIMAIKKKTSINNNFVLYKQIMNENSNVYNRKKDCYRSLYYNFGIKKKMKLIAWDSKNRMCDILAFSQVKIVSTHCDMKNYDKINRSDHSDYSGRKF
ncbi:hypothetical protein AGLY_014264 [Aphis glycines]|uniref:Uncharacterized protein n=1 Tax=Aphis glycines TaxID=307491 RepID=A0A6G0T638_APHGL|nr:hypothetical protein AGLY_014264 [Aphis glycines]